jgi:hypothetical protein
VVDECLEYVDILFIDTECKEATYHIPCGGVEIKGVHFCGVSQESIMLFTIEGISLLVNAFPLFLGALAKLRKATISFVMSVRLSVFIEQFGSHWTNFQEI